MKCRVTDTSPVSGAASTLVHLWVDESMERYTAPVGGGDVTLYGTRTIVHNVPESNDGYRSAHSWTKEEKTEWVVGEYFPEEECIVFNDEHSKQLKQRE